MNPFHQSLPIPVAGAAMGSILPDPVMASLVGAVVALVVYLRTQRAQARRDRINLLVAKLEALYLALETVARAAFEASYLPRQTEEKFRAAAVKLPQLCFPVRNHVDLYFPSLTSCTIALEEAASELSLWLLEFRGSDLFGADPSHSAKFREEAPARFAAFSKVVGDLRKQVRGIGAVLASGSIPTAPSALVAGQAPGQAPVPAPLLPVAGRGITRWIRTVAHAFLTPPVAADASLLEICRTFAILAKTRSAHRWLGPDHAPPRETLLELDKLRSEMGLKPPTQDQIAEIGKRLQAARIRRLTALVCLGVVLALLAVGVATGVSMARPSVQIPSSPTP